MSDTWWHCKCIHAIVLTWVMRWPGPGPLWSPHGKLTLVTTDRLTTAGQWWFIAGISCILTTLLTQKLDFWLPTKQEVESFLQNWRSRSSMGTEKPIGGIWVFSFGRVVCWNKQKRITSPEEAEFKSIDDSNILVTQIIDD